MQRNTRSNLSLVGQDVSKLGGDAPILHHRVWLKRWLIIGPLFTATTPSSSKAHAGRTLSDALAPTAKKTANATKAGRHQHRCP